MKLSMRNGYLSPAILLFSAALVGAQEARVTVRVLDCDTGVPITNALVSAGFETNIKPGWGWGAGKPNRVTGLTDTNGTAILDGNGNGGSVGIAVVNASGYYGSSGYQMMFTNVVGLAPKKWQPWNSTVEIKLKKIGNPIPMFAKKLLYVQIPAKNTSIGFDLEKGDWAHPFGVGAYSDFVIKMESVADAISSNRYGKIILTNDKLNISFSNDGDGVQPVTVPVRGGRSGPRITGLAPQNDYVTNVIKYVIQDEQGLRTDILADRNYIFRVRTEKDTKGNIVRARYGKIYGDFEFDHKGNLTFIYYLNPIPNDRNVEFDPKNNLFKNLSSREKVREP